MQGEKLDSSVIHRGLDRKLKLFGFEVFDLLFVLVFASVMNLLFGRTFLSLYLVFCLPLLILVFLYFGKRGKPQGFLVHWLRFYLTPGFYSAGQRQGENERSRRLSTIFKGTPQKGSEE